MTEFLNEFMKNNSFEFQFMEKKFRNYDKFSIIFPFESLEIPHIF